MGWHIRALAQSLRIRYGVVWGGDNPTARLGIRGFARKLFLSREFRPLICGSPEGCSFPFIQCLSLSNIFLLPIPFRKTLEFIEIVTVDINIKLTLIKADNQTPYI